MRLRVKDPHGTEEYRVEVKIKMIGKHGSVCFMRKLFNSA